MKSIKHIGFIGNYLPRRCGIATFTYDMQQSISTAATNVETSVVAMTDPGHVYDYPPAVRFQVHDDKIDDYVQAADFLNRSDVDVVCLQHEYGIFGGASGCNIIELLSRLKMPLVTTLHTVLRTPNPSQRNVMRRIINASAKLVVMSEKGQELLRSVHGVPASSIEIIPHGIPDFPFLETHHAKAKFGFSGRKVILTFGLLSPSKGIETVIDAMPGIIKSCPDVVYVVLGATHPNLVRHEGEAYRDRLIARVHELGVENHVAFLNQFVDQPTLLDYISMCDVYVTPYLNEAQMTSGTLSYSFGLGKAVVSTPYWHAKELLRDGLGILVPFKDPEATGIEVASLLTEDARRQSMRVRAYADSRSMIWAQSAKRYLAIFDDSRALTRSGISHSFNSNFPGSKGIDIPEIQIGHFLSLCDSTGMLQHATHAVANRAHGYCIDDNARALLFSTALANTGEVRIPDIVIARFAAFIQHAWNPATRRFRNFMSYDRRWLEEAGSEDSHGRTLWALGESARKDDNPSRRRWAAALFETALPAVENFSSPRAWAFSLLGLNAHCTLVRRDEFADRIRKQLADKLMALFAAVESKDWVWFENLLAYDNARLSQALIETGLATGKPAYIEAGLRSLRWLMTLQTASTGHFRPVGTHSFGRIRQLPEAFDQQPVEACATISACLAASRVGDGSDWAGEAMRAFRWFLGENDLRTTLIDPASGSCADGLHLDRPNENKGAESALSYLLGLTEIRQVKRANATVRTEPAARFIHSTVHSIAPRTAPGDCLATISILDPPLLIPAPGSGQGRRQTFQTGD